jgi:hypothetical protein
MWYVKGLPIFWRKFYGTTQTPSIYTTMHILQGIHGNKGNIALKVFWQFSWDDRATVFCPLIKCSMTDLVWVEKLNDGDEHKTAAPLILLLTSQFISKGLKAQINHSPFSSSIIYTITEEQIENNSHKTVNPQIWKENDDETLDMEGRGVSPPFPRRSPKLFSPKVYSPCGPVFTSVGAHYMP